MTLQQNARRFTMFVVLALLNLASITNKVCAADNNPPPAPNYANNNAWAAWPGRSSAADTIPPGVADPPLPAREQADVFFIHPTTYFSSTHANARYDEPGLTSSQIDSGVLRFQASAFNACCRMFVPHYRQAALAAFTTMDQAHAEAAFEIAYGDVLRAFDYYMAHENHGRPIIIASHSQGSLHALRLLQDRFANRPLQHQLVAAYVIGHYVPTAITSTGLQLCEHATQSGCIIEWNTTKLGFSGATHRRESLVWLNDRYEPLGDQAVLCTNPLNWIPESAAPASDNLGSLPGVKPREPLLPPVVALTGAACRDGALEVRIPLRQRRGFADALSALGSYHIYDYNLFYMNIRANVKQRIVAFK